MKKPITKRLDCHCYSGSEDQLIYSDNNLLPETVKVTVKKLSPFFKSVSVMIFWDGGHEIGNFLEEDDYVSAKIPAFGGKYKIYAFGICTAGEKFNGEVEFEVSDEG